MLSKALVKLIDKAIIPALLLLSSRIVSIILVAKYYGISFKIDSSGFVFQNSSDYVKVNSYSALIMTFMLVIGLGYVVIKSLFFHESHIKPTFTARLFSLKAESFIQNSYEIYTQGAIWLSYSYLLLIVSGIMSASGLMYSWVFYVILGITLSTTLIFILDMEEEIKIKKEDSVEYDMDRSFIELPGDLE
ncbi:hypothetical protein K0B04_00280 [Patescibacteria group bacterium]|nr:hypothetical protein [Patescibacteria group bacterium]